MQQDIIYNVFDPLSRGELWSVKIKHHTKINFWCQVQQVSELFRKNVPQRYFGSMTLWTLFLNRHQCVLDVRLMTPIKWVLESVFLYIYIYIYIYILYKWTVWWIHDSVLLLVNLFFYMKLSIWVLLQCWSWFGGIRGQNWNSLQLIRSRLVVFHMHPVLRHN